MAVPALARDVDLGEGARGGRAPHILPAMAGGHGHPHSARRRSRSASRRTPIATALRWLGAAALAVVWAAFAVLWIAVGVQGGLATIGLAGEPGRVVVTHCFPSRVDDGCSGTFEPDTAAGNVHVVGYHHVGDTVRVRLLGGNAWPAGANADLQWISALLIGLLLALAGGGAGLTVVNRLLARGH